MKQNLIAELALLPVIIAGVRTSAVWVGTATLAAPVGATSLWNLKERTGKHMFNTILP